jgi:PIN domain nuclease of toxin-antitoxin system
MKYLIDTHVLLWSLFDSKKLSKKLLEIFLNIENTIFVSLISFWEISLKYNLGKIELKNILPDDLPLKVEEAGFEILPLSPLEVSTFYKLPKFEHKDPFDRLIIWQSIHNKLTLVTKEINFEDYKDFGLRVIW